MKTRLLLAAALAITLLPSVGVSADPAPSAGVAWEPAPVSQPLYGTQPPSANPALQQHFVEADDGASLFVETWLPAEKDGNVPPAKVPTILIMTPYVVEGAHRYPASRLPSIIEYFTARGYAVAQHHVRGTGESGGCLEQTAANQIADGANVVEYLGRDAAWSNGNVGMYGRSYDAETQIATAGFGDPEKISYLKALVPIASVGSQYDWNFMDGVPWFLQPAVGNASYLLTSLAPGARVAPTHYPEKLLCQPEVLASSANQTGDFTRYWQDREYRPGAPNVAAATLMVHGLRDFNVQPITLAGWYDRLPETTAKKGLFGVWDHATPGGNNTVGRDWDRDDFLDMTTAWYDHYLKGLDTGVEDWPDVQVQSSDGQWWVAPDFPTTGGPMGQLALGPAGSLGATEPTGSTAFTEQRTTGTPRAGESVVFETAPLAAPLHLTGQPMLDLWVSSNLPDGHVAAKLEIIEDGSPARTPGNGAQATYGVRSLMHVDPMPNGWFEQEQGAPFPVATPTNVVVRFLPTDLVVPAGGSLRLTLSGSVSYAKGSSLPSGAGAQITIHHDCDHPSFLRFRMPDPDAELLNVREKTEAGEELTSQHASVGVRDGQGLSTATVCDGEPEALPFQ